MSVKHVLNLKLYAKRVHIEEFTNDYIAVNMEVETADTVAEVWRSLKNRYVDKELIDHATNLRDRMRVIVFRSDDAVEERERKNVEEVNNTLLVDSCIFPGAPRGRIR